MKPCPNCEQPVEPGTNFCPHCGADTRPLWTQPDDAGLLQLDMPDFTARRRGDKRSQFLGFMTSFLVSTFTFPFGFLIMLVVWSMCNRSNPYFAKGIKAGGLTVLILFVLLILGIFLICVGAPH